MLVGAAVQAGALRLPVAAVEEAIEINGVAVAANKAALAWGRLSVADPGAFEAACRQAGMGLGGDAGREPLTPALAQATGLDRASFTGETRRLAEVRVPELVAFQNETCAASYVAVLEGVWQAERTVTDRTDLSEAVARYLYKLTAYKDEYEVARLLTRDRGPQFASRAVPGGTELTFKLHPPMLRALGVTKKMRFKGSTQNALKALVPMKRLRGTVLDPFGKAHVRKVERELLRHYRAELHRIVSSLTSQSYDRAVEFAQLPDLVRGYEDVKMRNAERYVAALRDLGIDPPQV